MSALQRFAECPYQFHLSAIFRLAPLEEPAPLQRLDPLTRGSLFHRIQAEFFRALEKNGLLPVNGRRVDAARKMLEWAIATVSKQAKDDLAPAIDRVWSDELASIARDLRAWLELLARDGEHWTPERFEFAFGLPGDLDRDPRSVADPALVDGRFLIRGSIDLIERRNDGASLRVTDHKTGQEPHQRWPPWWTAAACCSQSSTAWRWNRSRVNGSKKEDCRFVLRSAGLPCIPSCWMTSVAAVRSKSSRSSIEPSSTARWRPAQPKARADAVISLPCAERTKSDAPVGNRQGSFADLDALRRNTVTEACPR